ncbi:HlyD family secretion protein [Nitrosomonas cryotolerans]|uniref:HlyD family secretion protein n=1 Tax=Nitrosomonas cryotolerans ATCC 49181 TaxID=1131553 RepID=A0A1N6IXL5_9PROT|nr:HlyD family efflux transporter periplasmic adaptor subunit [Nitrosomonas cryotolerans]SFP86002.1 HlyD family secretion protein [Nitrosomonas cryotolerans]SIO36750.1 HlyD family secretion protein [Nitrosomonas cryotolerans ATCC 49181]
MYRKMLHYLFIIISFVLINFSAYAEITYPLNTDRGIGSLGRIEPRSRVIKVSHNAGPEGARVAQLFFREADLVKSGGKLAVLSDYVKRKAEVEAAKARVNVLKAQRVVEQVTLAFNKKEHLRFESLKQNSVASISLADTKRLAFEQSEANLKRLSAEIASAELELRISEAELENTFIYAPITGTILKILAWPGERIRDSGLLEMADLTQLDVVAEIYESDLPRVKVGQKAYITAPGFRHPYHARVRELGFQVRKNDLNDTDPLADRDNRIIEVRLTLEPKAVVDLRHQIFRQVQVRIEP